MSKNSHRVLTLEDDPLWYKDAIIYQLHVKTFFDSDGDGIGDFKGLRAKLDYLQNLGVTAIWVLPFYPSPLKDDGYDIADYTGIHPAYGNLADFKAFLREAHRRGLRVVTELVINHTSDQHPWFQRARRTTPGSRWKDFYVWSDTPDRYQETRIIFQDFELSNWAWDPVAKSYYWHRFYSHQPDLNYDNPRVHKAILRVLDFWLGMGVDGLRLDAIPYLYEREGTNCENLPETHAFLKKLRAYVDANYRNRMFLGEANQWPEDAVAYYGAGDECHMSFQFPLMPRLFMALQMEDSFPIVDILDQTPAIPDNCQWAVFLRNHDELTLEMVTDEERDYMYRVYAQDPQMRLNLGIRRRLSPLLGNHRRRIELMNGLLFAMPGSPVIYYGDEIGMGDNVFLGDRNGVRTPMQWSADRNSGFSQAIPHRLYLPVIIDPEYHYEVVNVEAHENNRHSLLWWMRRLIVLRKRTKAFSRGTLEFVNPDNPRILSFVRRYGKECILVVANLSRYVQFAQLDLPAFQGTVPIEMFGRTEFPVVTGNPYFLTLGPHSFYWFYMQAQPAVALAGAEPAAQQRQPATIEVPGPWETIFKGKAKERLESRLPDYLQAQRWFGGKARQIKSARIQEILPLPHDSTSAYFTFVRVEYMDGNAETYQLPLAYATGQRAFKVLHAHPQAVVARLQTDSPTPEGMLIEALASEDFGAALLKALARRYRRKGTTGELLTTLTPAFRQLNGGEAKLPKASILKAEQSNTSVVYGKRFILKFFRRLQNGVNPDLEIGRFLTAKGFPHIPPVAGALEYRSGRMEPQTLAILQGFVPNQGDAWQYTLNSLNQYLEHVMEQRPDRRAAAVPSGSLLDVAQTPLPAEASALMGIFLESVRKLARRTAELHLILASASDDPQFRPETFSKLYQRSLYQAMRSLTGNTLPLLRRRLAEIPADVQSAARQILDQKDQILERFQSLLSLKITGLRTRCHGDYHLGQVLYTGKDFVIIDFEGEPARPLSERRIKRSPLRDVAGMLRSFHYAAYSALTAGEARGLFQPEDLPYLETWAEFWRIWACAVFLQSYFEMTAPGHFLPATAVERQILLDAFLLEKAIYELGYELNNRPDWVKIPLKGIRHLLRAPGGSRSTSVAD
ncbi:MAG: maltose alpha-D-glucosyltransferase [Desulfobacterales bacterium]|nr:MAG: maltose alpha-D-glucosyltransferase [Desulfobacterales bacterium]